MRRAYCTVKGKVTVDAVPSFAFTSKRIECLPAASVGGVKLKSSFTRPCSAAEVRPRSYMFAVWVPLSLTSVGSTERFSTGTR